MFDFADVTENGVNSVLEHSTHLLRLLSIGACFLRDSKKGLL